MSSKFYYFGFGSNMLAKRIHIQNPSAVRVGLGKLQDYRLDFHTSAKRWFGAPATIVPTSGAHVYGSIWEINCCHLEELDNQEGVHEGIYTAFTVPVLCVNKDSLIECRVYRLINQPTTELKGLPKEQIPYDRQPSKTYLKTIVKGAIETGVPEDYVIWLRSIKHNSKVVDVLERELELQNVNL